MAGFSDTDALIDTALDYYVNVGSGDADNTTLRARVLQFAQEALDEIWISGDYVFSYTTASVTIAAGESSGELPEDFLEFGEVGGIWDDSDGASGEQMRELRPVEAYGAIVAGESGEGRGVVAQFGLSSDNHRRTLYLPGEATNQQTIEILYRKIAPTLVDTTTDVDSNLLQLPRAYHNTVLFPRVIAKILKSLGDARWRDAEADYRLGLGKMAARERHRKTTVQRLPSSIKMF